MLGDPSALAVMIAAVILAGISKGGFGSGIGFLATPLMALVISPTAAVGVMLPILILIDHVNIIAYWRKWRWATVWPVMLTALAGIVAGALLFDQVDADVLRLGLGVISLVFTGFLIARATGWRPAPSRAAGRAARAGVWGAACGFTSTISHAGGPPITMYLLTEPVDKTAYQASSALIFWWIDLVKIAPYAMVGAIDLSTIKTSAALIPAALIGVAIGVFLHKRAPEKLFFQAMIALLTLTGLKLAWDGATSLFG